MPVDANKVDLFYGGDGEYFSYVKGELIVRNDPDLLEQLRAANPDHDLEVVDTATVGEVDVTLVRGFPTFKLDDDADVAAARQEQDADRRHPEIALAREWSSDVEVNHVMYAHHVHPSQRPHAGKRGPLTADWVEPLPFTGALVDNMPSYSGMRASPLHLNPLHLNPLHLNPLHLNPLHLNPLHLNLRPAPLHLNPLHMNGLASSAIPTTPNRRTGHGNELPEPPEEDSHSEDPVDVRVYIIDSGLGATAGGYDSPVLPRYGAIGAMSTFDDEPDRWEPWGQPPNGLHFVDPIAGHGTFIGGIYGQLLHAAGKRPEITVIQEMNPQGMIAEFDVISTIQSILAGHPNGEPGVLNLSFGGTVADFTSGGLSALEGAVNAASVPLVVVASAGNVSTDKEHYPAAFDSVVSVGALDRNGVAWFSNFDNEEHPWVDCWAEGVDIISTFLQLKAKWRTAHHFHSGTKMKQHRILGTKFAGFKDDPPNDRFQEREDWVAWSGTSFAAPIVGADVAKRLITNNDPATVKADVIVDWPKTELP